MLHRLASAARLWNGGSVAARLGPLPKPELVLYEYEASPYCRRVRETLCVLGLRVLVKPCPRETLRLEGAFGPASRHKPQVREIGGELLFPFLVDRTAGVCLNQSRDICEHLWRCYGDGVQQPRTDRLLNGAELPNAIEFALLAAPSGLRPWAGLLAATPTPFADALEQSPLRVHGCEPDAGSRAVRERLCELQLPYMHIPTPLPVSPRSRLEDPTTGFSTSSASAALDYLDERYRSCDRRTARDPNRHALPCAVSRTDRGSLCCASVSDWTRALPFASREPHRLTESASLFSDVPSPNLGDQDRTSWLTHALAAVPPRTARARQTSARK